MKIGITVSITAAGVMPPIGAVGSSGNAWNFSVAANSGHLLTSGVL